MHYNLPSHLSTAKAKEDGREIEKVYIYIYIYI
jgi:hypothetical protein